MRCWAVVQTFFAVVRPFCAVVQALRGRVRGFSAVLLRTFSLVVRVEVAEKVRVE
jgi:hypothetical protein